jgi:peptide-methionine (S)-S-oxide reductase
VRRTEAGELSRAGFGGSCHWCTEAIFEALLGVERVEQGWVASEGADAIPSEAVVVHYDPARIPLATLVAVHLATHSSRSRHVLRERYRSAVYTFTPAQAQEAEAALDIARAEAGAPLVTRVLPFVDFVLNEERYLHYYAKGPTLPFCETNIAPKLRALLARFPDHVKRGT